MSTSTAATRTFAIDPAHTGAGFSVRHLMIAKVRGTFGAITGMVTLPASGEIPASVTAEIDVASIDTREAQRDAHLKSPDFFDVAQYPTMRFTSTQIVAGDGSTFTLTGDLELHGHSQPVTFEAEVTGAGVDPFGRGRRVAYEAKARIKRSDFGLTWNNVLEAGGVAVGDEIDITLDVQALG